MSIEKPIVLTEYPKSGGSWITSMLGDILDIPKRDIYINPGFNLFDLSNHPWYENVEEFSFLTRSVIKSHELPNSPLINFDATYIHLIRDGRDVVVSKWFFEKDFCVKNGITPSFEKEFSDYVSVTAKEWSDYIQSWSEKAFVTIRYEDFLADPEGELKNLVAQLTEKPYAEEKFQKTVLKFSKKNFSASLSKTFRHNTFVRKGISGDWKNHFSQKVMNLFKEVAGDTLISLGYESSPNWNIIEGIGNNKESMRKCWCGNDDFLRFSFKYGECQACGTLVSQDSLSDEQLIVQDDEVDFYGKKYWTDHQNKDLGFPDIYSRTRNDLTERNLHWLKTMMKYCLPPAEVLELGCSHGSFVAAMQNAGYRASGVEMSPWVVSFGKETFDVPIYLGPVENIVFPESNFDIIILMDVLEHLPNPSYTLQKCMSMLKPDGLFLIQTPEFKEDVSHSNLVEAQSPFLEQLKADEHLYLFSQSSVLRLLKQIGFEYVNFEPAIFSDYDMFLVAGRQPLKTHSTDECEKVLLGSPSGRMVLALLDIRERELALREQLIACDNDRIDKLEQISKLSDWLKQTQASQKETQASLESIKSKLSNPFVRIILQAIRTVNQISKQLFNKV